jgi:hypothetical protein
MDALSAYSRSCCMSSNSFNVKLYIFLQNVYTGFAYPQKKISDIFPKTL